MEGFVLAGVCAGVGVAKAYDSKHKKYDSGKEKFKSYYKILNQWLQLKQNNVSLERWFTTNGYNSVAIYGFGELGKRLYEELKDSKTDVKYVIDKNISASDYDIGIFSLDEELESVDIVVVTSVFDYDNIKNDLQDKGICQIVSLEDVVFEL